MASVANTYARAFAEAVIGMRLDAGLALREAQSVAALVDASRELREVWEAPSIPAEQKRGVLDAIVAREGISRPVRNFVAVLIDHHRIHFLGEIVKQSEKELNQRLGFAEAEISSARELSAAERQGLEAQVSHLTGKKVRARYSLDRALLGGAVIKIGSTIYDGSVLGQLERIKEAISS